MGIARFPRQTEGISTDRFSCFHKTGISDELPKWQPARVGAFFTLILRQLSFKDSLMVWIVMLCVSCHQKQVILVTLLQGWRNLLMAWMMLLDAGGTFWTEHFVVMVWFPPRADRCCYVLYSNQTCKQNWNKTCSTQGHGTNDISLESRARSEGDAAFEKMLDPIEGSPATGNSVAGIVKLFVDDLFGTGGTEMEQRVLAGLQKRISKLVQKTGMMCF